MVLNLLEFTKILFVAKLTKLIDGYDKRVDWSNGVSGVFDGICWKLKFFLSL